MSRDEALEILEESPYDKEKIIEDLNFIVKRMGITVEEFEKMMKESNKSYKDYKNTSLLIKLGVIIARILGIEKRQFR